ncbi:MAG TPA: hypothetical protein VM328_05655 [Fimbriimonadaceae bacterium]|nr:hypothetical protein [Fimbriimonadaceae bacterium]
MKRILYTLAVGKPKFAEMAMGLGRSLSLIGDDTERVVVTDQGGYDWHRYFKQVLEPEDPLEWIFFSKLTALARTDADQVLFVDGDSLAFKRLGPIFDYCAGSGFAVQGIMQSDGDWYGDLASHCRRHDVDALPRFNGGMIYYERGSEPFIEKCYEYGRRAVELGFQRDDPLIPDEPCIALAMVKERYGLLVPETMDFTNTAVGLVGKLRMDVLRGECRYVCRRYDLRYVEPTIFHASRYGSFLVYWRQLARLEALERYEDRHGYGYMSPWQKLRRSLERRYLRYVARKL